MEHTNLSRVRITRPAQPQKLHHDRHWTQASEQTGEFLKTEGNIVHSSFTKSAHCPKVHRERRYKKKETR